MQREGGIKAIFCSNGLCLEPCGRGQRGEGDTGGGEKEGGGREGGEAGVRDLLHSHFPRGSRN